jgi:hypothetical protein
MSASILAAARLLGRLIVRVGMVSAMRRYWGTDLAMALL